MGILTFPVSQYHPREILLCFMHAQENGRETFGWRTFWNKNGIQCFL